jgi:hypothetical protein
MTTCFSRCTSGVVPNKRAELVDGADETIIRFDWLMYTVQIQLRSKLAKNAKFGCHIGEVCRVEKK